MRIFYINISSHRYMFCLKKRLEKLTSLDIYVIITLKKKFKVIK